MFWTTAPDSMCLCPPAQGDSDFTPLELSCLRVSFFSFSLCFFLHSLSIPALSSPFFFLPRLLHPSPFSLPLSFSLSGCLCLHRSMTITVFSFSCFFSLALFPFPLLPFNTHAHNHSNPLPQCSTEPLAETFLIKSAFFLSRPLSLSLSLSHCLLVSHCRSVSLSLCLWSLSLSLCLPVFAVAFNSLALGSAVSCSLRLPLFVVFCFVRPLRTLCCSCSLWVPSVSCHNRGEADDGYRQQREAWWDTRACWVHCFWRSGGGWRLGQLARSSFQGQPRKGCFHVTTHAKNTFVVHTFTRTCTLEHMHRHAQVLPHTDTRTHNPQPSVLVLIAHPTSGGDYDGPCASVRDLDRKTGRDGQRQRNERDEREREREWFCEHLLHPTLCIKPFCFAFDQMSSWYSAAGFGWSGSYGSWYGRRRAAGVEGQKYASMSNGSAKSAVLELVESYGLQTLCECHERRCGCTADLGTVENRCAGEDLSWYGRRRAYFGWQESFRELEKLQRKLNDPKKAAKHIEAKQNWINRECKPLESESGKAGGVAREPQSAKGNFESGYEEIKFSGRTCWEKGNPWTKTRATSCLRRTRKKFESSSNSNWLPGGDRLRGDKPGRHETVQRRKSPAVCWKLRDSTGK